MDIENLGQNHIESSLKKLRSGGYSSEAWDREWETLEFFCDELGSPLSRGAALVDVGCGGRELADGAAKRGLNYIGLDIDDGNFELERLPVADASADLVVALAIIEHLHSPDNLMKEIYRILKPGGVLVVSTPNWRYAWKTFFDNPAHVHPYTVKSLATLCEAYGFSNHRVAPGLRAKPKFFYFNPWAFQIAAALPFRGRPRFVPSWFSGRATSIFAFATKSRDSGDSEKANSS